MSIHEKALAQFAAKKHDLTPIEVPEWEETIYFKPMTLKEKAELSKYADNAYEYAARALLRRGLDSEGKELFIGVSLTDMMNDYDPVVVERIVIEMAGGESLEDSEKN